jgi:hypothetical protein
MLQLPLANLQMIDRQLENLYKTRPKEKQKETISENKAVDNLNIGMHL